MEDRVSYNVNSFLNKKNSKKIFPININKDYRSDVEVNGLVKLDIKRSHCLHNNTFATPLGTGSYICTKAACISRIIIV